MSAKKDTYALHTLTEDIKFVHQGFVRCFPRPKRKGEAKNLAQKGFKKEEHANRKCPRNKHELSKSQTTPTRF